MPLVPLRDLYVVLHYLDCKQFGTRAAFFPSTGQMGVRNLVPGAGMAEPYPVTQSGEGVSWALMQLHGGRGPGPGLQEEGRVIQPCREEGMTNPKMAGQREWGMAQPWVGEKGVWAGLETAAQGEGSWLSPNGRRGCSLAPTQLAEGRGCSLAQSGSARGGLWANSVLPCRVWDFGSGEELQYYHHSCTTEVPSPWGAAQTRCQGSTRLHLAHGQEVEHPCLRALSGKPVNLSEICFPIYDLA